jgi:hypothetical protein
MEWRIKHEFGFVEIREIVKEEIIKFNKETDDVDTISTKISGPYLMDVFYRRRVPPDNLMLVLARVINVEFIVLYEFFQVNQPWSWVIKKDEGESEETCSPLLKWKEDNNITYPWIRLKILKTFKKYIPHHEKAKSHYTREYIVAVFNGAKKPGGDLAYCLSKLTKIPLADIFDHILHRQYKEGLEKEEVKQ